MKKSLHSLPDIRKIVEINAPIEKVWQAVATSEGLAAWLMKNDFQPVLGHEFTLLGAYGAVPCKVLEIDPPKRLFFSWDDFGWHVTFELMELNGKTQFTAIHSGWGEAEELVPKANEKNSKIHGIMDDGWTYLTKGLRDKLNKDED